MQMDADEEDQPFFKPEPIQTEPLVPRTGPGDAAAATAATDGREDQASSSEATPGAAGRDDETETTEEGSSQVTADTDD